MNRRSLLAAAALAAAGAAAPRTAAAVQGPVRPAWRIAMTRSGTCFFAALCVFASFDAHSTGPYGSIEIGNWKGGAYTNDATGVFSHCAAGAPYLSGIQFIVSINAAGAWSLGFAHQSWQLRQGETIPIDLTFDGRSQFHVFGSALNSILVIVPMPVNSELIGQFRRSHAMAAWAKGQLFQFNLNTTSQLLPALSTCVAQAKSGPLTSIKIQAKAPPRQAPAVSSLQPNQPSGEPPPSAEVQIEAIELASNFVLRSQLQNPKVLSRSETPTEFASFGAAWRSDEAMGAVKIIAPQGDMKGIDVAAAVAAADAKECNGKFASGRVSELVDSDVVFRGFATCEDSAGSRVAQYFIVPRKRGGFVMFSVVSNMKSDPSRNVVRDEKLPDFRKAALTSATQ